MIRLRDSEITDILPSVLAEKPEVQALSYALGRAVKRTLEYCNGTSVYAVIDELPESVLDLLALDIKTQYYKENMDIATKRNLVKETLRWHSKAGTTAAMTELVNAVFGTGRVVEWFDFEEGPYTPCTFDIVVEDEITEDMRVKMGEIIQNVKNIRSHLREIKRSYKIEGASHIYAGFTVSGQFKNVTVEVKCYGME